MFLASQFSYLVDWLRKQHKTNWNLAAGVVANKNPQDTEPWPRPEKTINNTDGTILFAL